MAARMGILLLAALYIGTANCLQCYTCIGANSNSNCKTSTTCAPGEGYCQTTVSSASIGGVSATSISKLCAATCTPTSTGFSVASASVSCCTSDLCNTSGAGAMKSSTSAIFLALGTAAMILAGAVL